MFRSTSMSTLNGRYSSCFSVLRRRLLFRIWRKYSPKRSCFWKRGSLLGFIRNYSVDRDSRLLVSLTRNWLSQTCIRLKGCDWSR